MLLEQLKALMERVDPVSDLANGAALLNWYLEDINWVGFYLWREERNELVLGPFQGLPACVRIPFGRGVCGTAFAENRTIRVDDVHNFPGHIACDGASRSEIVIPLRKEGRPVGVLDIDSPLKGRFSEEDQAFLEEAARLTIL
ncbi:MAG: GAF domain-containing protein [Spirochaetales bacterium]|nr:GAF domain-containing protein [Spirochaetales bacterium]